MRILHTSDWHLGRSFHGVDLLGAQAAFLEHLVEVVRSEAVDVVLVAGDVYDRALPGVDAVQVLDDGLAALVGAGAQVVVSSGNHDSAVRLGFGSRLLAGTGLHLRTHVARAADPVLLADEHGEVAFYPLPYLEPAVAARALGSEASHAGVLGAAAAAVRADLARRPGARSVLAAHAFVTGGQGSDSERALSVGGIGQVPASLFDGVDYVALGHLHGRQRLAETVRYSGSPLAFSFSEAGHTKGSWLVELGADGVSGVTAVDAPVPRRLARLRGRLDDLLMDVTHAEAENAWCQVTLTDAERPAAPMERLRTRFPDVLELRFEPEAGATAPSEASYAARTAGRPDLEVCCGFLEHVRGRATNGPESTLLNEALEAVLLADVEGYDPVAAQLALDDAAPVGRGTRRRAAKAG
ncbi:exonuclease SbcCD subunit D [Spongisporangium articulatum]|uniref:Nuclease SbcCD subunit D n=1 Tax=Spongisporangium articulatum TaxID=3362603 RepID=A0ABW8AMI1_9ACTN